MALNKKTLWQVRFAAHVIRMGGVVAHPTEAIWGLACDPFNPQAVARLLTIKQRPLSKGLILVSGQSAHFESLLSPLPDNLRARFFQQTSHPITWLVPDKHDLVPHYLRGQHSSIALRLTQHTVFAALSQVLGHALVSTSANPTGRQPADSLFKVNQYFANEIDYILPAVLGGFSKPSEIRDLKTNSILRF